MFEKGLFGFCLLAVCSLVRSGLAQVPEPAQCLVSENYNLIRLPENKDDKSCYDDCLEEPGCNMAVVTNPLSGPHQCLLVNCLNQGKIFYPRDPSARISVYPKSTIDDEQKENLMKGAFGLVEERFQCFRPMESMYSSCQSGSPKFFYNSTSYRCERFFSGCGSTRNTFDTQQSCEALCTEKYRCYRPMDHGEYPPVRFSVHEPETPEELANRPHNFIFYNVSSSSCEGFFFKGSRSNGNIFRTVDECESLCGGVKVDEEPEDLVCPNVQG